MNTFQWIGFALFLIGVAPLALVALWIIAENITRWVRVCKQHHQATPPLLIVWIALFVLSLVFFVIGAFIPA